jgi:hypothetical protein
VEKPDAAAENRDRVAAKMTPAEIAEAEKLAREWKPKPERSFLSIEDEGHLGLRPAQAAPAAWRCWRRRQELTRGEGGSPSLSAF